MILVIKLASIIICSLALQLFKTTGRKVI